MKLIINNEDIEVRLDKYLQSRYPDKSRSHIKHWIEDGIVLVNGKTVKAGYLLRATVNHTFFLSLLNAKYKAKPIIKAIVSATNNQV